MNQPEDGSDRAVKMLQKTLWAKLNAELEPKNGSHKNTHIHSWDNSSCNNELLL